MAKSKPADGTALAKHVAGLDWPGLTADLDARGFAVIPGLLSAEQCRAVTALYPDDERFRKRVVMEQHGYGRGEYRYFAYPLPPIVAALRTALYPPLAEVADRWNEALKIDVRYPADHAAYVERCHQAGQTRPTPLVLRYGPGDFNCLHQDVYGEHVFPFQVVVLLKEPGTDFTGGEFVLTEQRPRMQSRVEVVPLELGDAAIFPVRDRPVRGSRGWYRVNLRHGVSRLRTGERYTLGIIFHDAK
jgi:uncharacterized protein